MTKVACDQEVWDEVNEELATITGHEVYVCIYKEGDIEETLMFKEKGLKVGKADGLDWLNFYLPIKSKLDPRNMGYQGALTELVMQCVHGISSMATHVRCV